MYYHLRDTTDDEFLVTNLKSVEELKSYSIDFLISHDIFNITDEEIEEIKHSVTVEEFVESISSPLENLDVQMSNHFYYDI
jgi:hypothetical protein